MSDFNFDKEPVVCITLDTDWCKPVGVDHVVGILSEYDIPATIFCTGDYDIPTPHERAIHPCINDHRRAELIMEPVQTLREIIPEANGNRCHRLEMNSFLYAGLPGLGFIYDSSWPLIGQTGITPLTLYSGLIELPVFYTDYDFILADSIKEFEKAFLSPGLKVLLFHPGHVYHNSTAESYDTLNSIPQAERFRPELITKGFGLGEFFRHVLSMIRENNLTCATCSEVAENSREAS